MIRYENCREFNKGGGGGWKIEILQMLLSTTDGENNSLLRADSHAPHTLPGTTDRRRLPAIPRKVSRTHRLVYFSYFLNRVPLTC